MAEERNTDRLDEFVRLLMEHDRGMMLFILSLVPNWDDAEEIRQETNVKLWQEFGSFRSGSDFGKWSRTIARYEALNFKNRKHRGWGRMSQKSVDLLTADVEEIVDVSKKRQSTVAECVDELSPFSRKLVRLYYTVGRKMREIAGELCCSPDAAYKALQRARIELRQCVDRKLGEGDEP
jgi:RNA polymerase sigma-70 factor, ECF subfamily